MNVIDVTGTNNRPCLKPKELQIDAMGGETCNVLFSISFRASELVVIVVAQARIEVKSSQSVTNLI